ncbi:MAG: alpha/beta hydrolase [Frankiales bacterium]|nr:MAG: alpha/beta hydrolase [Frankiales bacterium]
MSATRVVSVPVRGGDLAVEVVDGSTTPVLAVHGISSTRRLWDWLRAEMPELSLIAPDLRGRGDSVDVAGDSSVPRHAEDMVAVLDALGLDAVHVCGMSMGGFVAIDLAHRFPDRVRSLVLVDGGFPMAAPPGLTRELLPLVFQDRLARLEQTWDSLDDYVDFFVTSTGPLFDPNDAVLRGYAAHDLRDGRVRLSGAALVADAESVYFGENPWELLDLPIRFSHAEWSTGKDSAPAYPPEAVERYRTTCVTTRFLPGLDHGGSIMTPAGAAATAELLREALA